MFVLILSFFVFDKFPNNDMPYFVHIAQIILSAFKALTTNPSLKNLKSLLSFGKEKKNENGDTGVWMSDVSDD